MASYRLMEAAIKLKIVVISFDENGLSSMKNLGIPPRDVFGTFSKDSQIG